MPTELGDKGEGGYLNLRGWEDEVIDRFSCSRVSISLIWDVATSVGILAESSFSRFGNWEDFPESVGPCHFPGVIQEAYYVVWNKSVRDTGGFLQSFVDLQGFWVKILAAHQNCGMLIDRCVSVALKTLAEHPRLRGTGRIQRRHRYLPVLTCYQK